MSRDRVDIRRRSRMNSGIGSDDHHVTPIPCGRRIPHPQAQSVGEGMVAERRTQPASGTGWLPVAAHLRRLLRLGEITPVPVPDHRQVEVVRDLVRAREAAPMRPDNDAAGSTNRRAARRQPCSWSAAGRFPGADGQHGCRQARAGADCLAVGARIRFLNEP